MAFTSFIFRFEMQPDASVKQLNYETKWLSPNFQSIGNLQAVTFHVQLETGIAKHSKLQNMFKILCN